MRTLASMIVCASLLAQDSLPAQEPSDTPTDGGSLAKPFTAAALLSLVGAGRLSMEMPVRDVLPEYPHPATRIRHLLSHSAGLPSYEWLDTPVPATSPARTRAISRS